MEKIMATNITVRLPESIIPKLDAMAEESIGGKRCRSPFLDILLKSFKVEVKLVPRDGNEEVNIDDKPKDIRKMMTFSMSTQSMIFLKSMSNDTGLSQSQCIEYIVSGLYNQSTEGEE